MYCKNCSKEISEKSYVCPSCGVLTGNQDVTEKSDCSRTGYILLGLFLWPVGAHNWYAGYYGRATAQLCIMLFFFWLIVPIFIVSFWVIIDLIITTTDGKGRKFL